MSLKKYISYFFQTFNYLNITNPKIYKLSMFRLKLIQQTTGNKK